MHLKSRYYTDKSLNKQIHKQKKSLLTLFEVPMPSLIWLKSITAKKFKAALELFFTSNFKSVVSDMYCA